MAVIEAHSEVMAGLAHTDDYGDYAFYGDYDYDDGVSTCGNVSTYLPRYLEIVVKNNMNLLTSPMDEFIRPGSALSQACYSDIDSY